jgi:hypothetical protein
MTNEHWIFPISANERILLKLVLRQEGFLALVIHLFLVKLTRQYVEMEAKGLRQRAEPG